MKRKLFRVTMIAVGMLGLVVTGVHAAAFYAIVTPDNYSMPLGFVEETSGEASLMFVPDAGTSAAGIGSLEFRVENARRNSAAGAALRLESGWSLPLEHIVIRYSTYVQSAEHCVESIKKRGSDRDDDNDWDRDSDRDDDNDWDRDSDRDDDNDWDGDDWKKAKNHNAAVALTMSVDSDNDGVADDLLIFDPAFNGDIFCETWQQWPATAGLWYSPKGGTFAAPGRPLAHYVVEYPRATVVTDDLSGSGISLAAGFGGKKWQGFIGNADGLSISDPRPSCVCTNNGMSCLGGTSGFYDFEPVARF